MSGSFFWSAFYSFFYSCGICGSFFYSCDFFFFWSGSFFYSCGSLFCDFSFFGSFYFFFFLSVTLDSLLIAIFFAKKQDLLHTIHLHHFHLQHVFYNCKNTFFFPRLLETCNDSDLTLRPSYNAVALQRIKMESFFDNIPLTSFIVSANREILFVASSFMILLIKVRTFRCCTMVGRNLRGGMFILL